MFCIERSVGCWCIFCSVPFFDWSRFNERLSHSRRLLWPRKWHSPLNFDWLLVLCSLLYCVSRGYWRHLNSLKGRWTLICRTCYWFWKCLWINVLDSCFCCAWRWLSWGWDIVVYLDWRFSKTRMFPRTQALRLRMPVIGFVVVFKKSQESFLICLSPADPIWLWRLFKSRCWEILVVICPVHTPGSFSGKYVTVANDPLLRQTKDSENSGICSRMWFDCDAVASDWGGVVRNH